MQDTLRLMVFTVIGVIGIWFVIMSINVHLFLHTDIDSDVSGIVPISRTDIGNQCGDQYQNSNEFVDFKLNTGNQIVYLCPLGISPIRHTVIATTLTDKFKALLTPKQLAKISAAYAASGDPSQTSDDDNTVTAEALQHAPAAQQPTGQPVAPTASNNPMAPQQQSAQPGPQPSNQMAPQQQYAQPTQQPGNQMAPQQQSAQPGQQPGNQIAQQQQYAQPIIQQPGNQMAPQQQYAQPTQQPGNQMAPQQQYAQPTQQPGNQMAPQQQYAQPGQQPGNQMAPQQQYAQPIIQQPGNQMAPQQQYAQPAPQNQ
jgi:hypothetical protein